MKNKAMQIRMKDETGNEYRWTVRSFQRAWNCGGHIAKPRYISGWSYTDHEGCTRSVEGNWLDLVAAFRLTSENYGLTSTIS